MSEQLTGGQTVPLEPVVGHALVPMRLTAENGAKGLMIGEFSVEAREDCQECDGTGDSGEIPYCQACDGIGHHTRDVPVDWTTIKAIWARAADYFASQRPNASAQPGLCPTEKSDE